MKRRHVSFHLDGDSLAGTLDQADATTGLLIVSGGNELRCGPFGSHAELANRIATAGFPVFRFDRRGVGDSSGTNMGFTGSADDIAAALKTFRAHVPRLRHVVAYGNCDAASALMLCKGQGFAGMVLANPWTFEPEPPAQAEPDAGTADGAPQEPANQVPDPGSPQMTPAALRAHYLRRLTNPAALKRLFSGRIKVRNVAESLVEAIKPAPATNALTRAMAGGLKQFDGSVALLLAENDRTAQAFLGNWDRADPRLRKCPGASHGFAEPQARIWLQGQLLGALRAQH